MKRKTVALVLSTMMAVSLFAGCGSSDSGKADNSTTAEAGTTAAAAEADTTAAQADNSDEASYVVGISQFAEHGSLDNCRNGFLEGLAEAGIVEGQNLEVVFDNAQADTGTASTIASNMVAKNVDLICAIATPSAAAAYNACMETEIPVVYSAISDPVAAGLANADGTSTGNITGTSDVLPVSAQLEMIRALMPEASKIGIIYTTSEENSISTIATYKELAANYNFEIVDSGISATGEVEMAAADLVTKVDCICNLTDNTVVQALQVVLAKANDAKIPVFGSEIEQVKNGCVASMGIDYLALGKVTGQMAAKVLKGESKASEMNFEAAEEAELYVNTAAAEKIGMELDAAYIADAVETFNEVIVE